VASLTVSARAVCQDAVHLGLEFAVVRIHVTTRAGLVGKVELGNSGSGDQRWLVAVQAGHSSVRPFQCEPSLLVPGQCESARAEAMQVMAVLTLVLVRTGIELPPMLINMAVGATTERNLEFHCHARWGVATGAGNLGVLCFERIGRCGVLLHAVRGRFEPILGVTGGALRSARPLPELPAVRIGRVTIHAARMSHRLPKIAAVVAVHTANGGMLAHKRKVCLRVVK